MKVNFANVAGNPMDEYILIQGDPLNKCCTYQRKKNLVKNDVMLQFLYIIISKIYHFFNGIDISNDVKFKLTKDVK